MFVVMLYCKGNINLRLPMVETDSLQLPFSVIMKTIPTCYYRNKGEVENIFTRSYTKYVLSQGTAYHKVM